MLKKYDKHNLHVYIQSIFSLLKRGFIEMKNEQNERTIVGVKFHTATNSQKRESGRDMSIQTEREDNVNIFQ